MANAFELAKKLASAKAPSVAGKASGSPVSRARRMVSDGSVSSASRPTGMASSARAATGTDASALSAKAQQQAAIDRRVASERGGRGDVYSRDASRRAAAEQAEQDRRAEELARQRARQEMEEARRAAMQHTQGTADPGTNLVVDTGPDEISTVREPAADPGPAFDPEDPYGVADQQDWIREQFAGPRDTAQEEALARQELQEQMESDLMGQAARLGAMGMGASGAQVSMAGDLRRQAAQDMLGAQLGIRAGARDEELARAVAAGQLGLGSRGLDIREDQYGRALDLLEEMDGGGADGEGDGGGGGPNPLDPTADMEEGEDPFRHALDNILADREQDDPANWAHTRVGAYGGAYTPESLEQMGASRVQSNEDHDVWMLPDGRILQVGTSAAGTAVTQSGGQMTGGR